MPSILTIKGAYLIELNKVKHEAEQLSCHLIVHSNSHKHILVGGHPAVRHYMNTALDALVSASACVIDSVDCSQTFNVLPTCSSAASTIVLMLHEIWAGRGRRLSGFPFRTMLQKARSDMMVKGRLLSAHHKAHSTLHKSTAKSALLAGMQQVSETYRA